MTDFRKDILHFAEMIASREITYFDVYDYGSYYEIEADERRYRYDRVTEERI